METLEEVRSKLEHTDSVDYRGFRVQVELDEYPFNPRNEFDYVGTMVCWHSRYILGDKMPKEEPMAYYEQEIAPLVRAGGVCLNLWLYDHRGITMRAAESHPFALDRAQWDSGQVGWIYCSADRIKEEWGEGPAAHDQAIKYMEGEVREYDDYLTGNVYGFIVQRQRSCGHCYETLDSCGGFIGDRDYAVGQALECLAAALDKYGEADESEDDSSA